MKIILLLIIVTLSSCTTVKVKKPKPRTVKLLPTSYSKIDGWNYDNHLIALKTFNKSCDAILEKKTSYNISNTTKLGGKAIVWQKICKILKKSNIKTNLQSKKFFEKFFLPYKTFTTSPITKFTGYYEIELNGSKRKTKKAIYPVYMPMKNLESHKKKHYLSHSAINNGALKNKNLELAWVDNHARLYFMHIQGSGIIKLDNGKVMRVGYAGENGFEYTSIGPLLKHYTNTKIDSALGIMEWLHKNPYKRKHIIEQNKSFVFFKEINADGPIGAQGIHLTPERSIAIDAGLFPYGMPVWVETKLPKTKNYKERAYKRLFIAQDTGGAIKGMRADIFFGRGKRSEELACYMNNQGKMYILLPKNITVPTTYTSK